MGADDGKLTYEMLVETFNQFCNHPAVPVFAQPSQSTVSLKMEFNPLKRFRNYILRRRITLAIAALQTIAAKLAVDVAALVAQNATLSAAAANAIQQSDVDAITAQLTAVDNSVVAAITPASPAVPTAAPSAPPATV